MPQDLRSLFMVFALFIWVSSPSQQMDQLCSWPPSKWKALSEHNISLKLLAHKTQFWCWKPSTHVPYKSMYSSSERNGTLTSRMEQRNWNNVQGVSGSRRTLTGTKVQINLTASSVIILVNLTNNYYSYSQVEIGLFKERHA